MPYDLWNNIINFDINGVNHHIELHQNSATASIDGMQLYNVNYVTNFNFHLPSFESGTEMITIFGHNKEGESLMYTLFIEYNEIHDMNIGNATATIVNFLM